MAGSFLRDPTGFAGQHAMLPGRSVLCVLPNPSQRELLTSALTTFRVSCVGSALDAIRAINGHPFDAYVLDYWLPDWAGASLCRDIRKSDPSVPVVFVTAAGDRHMARALRAGASAYFGAAMAAAAIRERLVSLVERAEARSEHARHEAARVVERELARHAVAADEHAAEGWAAPSLIVHTLKARAQKAFIDAGGTRSAFERSWSRQLEEIAGRRGAGRGAAQVEP